MYEELLAEVETIGNLRNAASVLKWDQEVVMPEKGTEARAAQLSTLSSLAHEKLTSGRIGELLEEVDPEGRGGRAVVREVEREHRRAKRVPDELVRDISKATTEAFSTWRRAKERDDYCLFEPALERVLELKVEYAEHIDPKAEPYEVLFEDFEPYLELPRAEDLLIALRDGITPLVEGLSGKELETEFREVDVPEETGMELCRRALKELGFDFERGRLDTSPHPFTSGNQFDARLTTRFDSGPVDGLMSTIHEFGHALYGQALPPEHYATPLGESREMTVHESQSRLWENHVGRSQEFWEFFAPMSNSILGSSAEAVEFFRHVNRVEPRLIRVESDELTYHQHIVLRFEIERGLVSGEIDVEEVPELWDDGMVRYLGIQPDEDAEGPLQDVHWAHGSFGYFPTYSLGSLLAAQMFDAMEEETPDLVGTIADGDFGPIVEWLRDRVHRHGKLYTTDELIETATGSELSENPFLSYAEKKFGELYRL